MTYDCAFCGEENETFVDASGGARQTYTEDCAVCCRPNLITVTVDEDGKVQDVKVVGGPQPFVDPVVAAVKQFVYEPQLVDGKPSVATIQASYHFGPPR